MVNKERMLDEYRTLVSFDSESFHEKIIAAYLYDRLSELGLSVSSDDAGSLLSAGEDSAGNIYG
ncbi:MAG: peptidase M20, partial [Lachnospiraceae bacterium]|nr:peptidase M20 [Lachnospiraceae bacterium]